MCAYKAKMFLVLGGLFVMATESFSYDGGKLLQQSDLVYKGAFRVPKGKYGASTKTYSLSYGGDSLSFNIKNKSLFILGHSESEKLLYEITVPSPVISNNISELNTATILRGGIDITGGIGYDRLGIQNTVIPNGGKPGSLLVHNDKLIGNSWAYYDGSNKAVNSHFTANIDWTSGSGFKGFYSVGLNPENPLSANGGFVGGYMCSVPTEWQSDFGGPALTGLGGVSVITRSSFGPAAWVFDPANLVVETPATPVPATMLVGYPSSHRTLGNYSSGNLVYNSTSEIRGVVFPSGTRTVLFFGRHGLGADNYGAGTNYTGQTTYGPATSNISEVGRIATSIPNTCGSAVVAGGDVCSYDPADSTKGVHAYPYVYRIWAYDANELVSVKKGLKNAWDVIPYGVWNITLPFAVNIARIGNVAYDPNTQRIYISQLLADRPSVEPFPLIHVFEVSALSSPNSPANLRGTVLQK